MVVVGAGSVVVGAGSVTGTGAATVVGAAIVVDTDSTATPSSLRSRAWLPQPAIRPIKAIAIAVLVSVRRIESFLHSGTGEAGWKA
jgi:hypothetical protein